MLKQKKQNKNLVEIVRLLSNKNSVSGNDLASTLGVSRSAIWKAVKKLQQYNIPITPYKNGYKLNSDLTLLDQDYIFGKLNNRKNITLEIFETIESTNQYYLDKTNLDNTKEHICLAEFQSQGKGRLGRNWLSPFGQNICLSICIFMNIDLSKLGGLSLTVSLAIANTLSNFAKNDEIKVKWPNDVICNRKKLSGSLIQIISEQNGLCKIVIGVGVNINSEDHEDLTKQINQDWCSLKEIIGQTIERNIITVELINNILVYLEKFKQHGFEQFVTEWEKLDYFLNQEISLKNNDQIITGIDKGIDTHGQILLAVDGKIHAFSCGETTFSKRVE